MSLKLKWFKKYELNYVVVILCCLLVISCSDNNNSRNVETLVISVVPNQKKEIQQKVYQPLVKYIFEQTGIKTTLLIPDSYEQLLNWFTNKQVDFAMFGGVTYVKARRDANAEALIMRDIDTQFNSIVLTHAGNPAETLRDLKGATFSFGSRLSTSGHFMPRYFFQKKNIEVNEFFSDIKYSGAHDRTAEWVRDGKVDAGVVNASIVDDMFKDNRLSDDNIKVLWHSPPYADYVWAIQADISESTKSKIRDVFLHMNQNEDGTRILNSMNAKYFIPAYHNDFSDLETIITQIENKR